MKIDKLPGVVSAPFFPPQKSLSRASEITPSVSPADSFGYNIKSRISVLQSPTLLFKSEEYREALSFSTVTLPREDMSLEAVKLLLGKIKTTNEKARDQVQKDLMFLARTKPGMALIEQLRPLFFDNQSVAIDPFSHERSFSFSDLSIHYSQGERVFYDADGCPIKQPQECVLAHELIHLLNYLKDPQQVISRTATSTFLIDSSMSNQEEQLVISGITHILFPSAAKCAQFEVTTNKGRTLTFALTNPLCENAFLIALGIAPRVDHKAHFVH